MFVVASIQRCGGAVCSKGTIVYLYLQAGMPFNSRKIQLNVFFYISQGKDAFLDKITKASLISKCHLA